MIRINLLPTEAEAAPTPINPVIPLVTAALLPMFVLVPIHLGQSAKKSRIEKDVINAKNDLDRYQPIIAKVDELEKTRKTLTDRKGVINQLESERLRYPQFMEDFLKLLPTNMWLTNLTTAIQPNGNQMTVGMDVQALDNYAIADLIANLETSQIFTDVDLGTINVAASATGGSTMSFHVNTVYRKAAVPDAIKKS